MVLYPVFHRLPLCVYLIEIFHIPVLIEKFSLVETLGYLARYISAKETPDWTTKPYIAQSLMLLLAPAFFAASIYMILGRIIRLLNGASCSLVRPSWLTKIFVTGDVLSFFIQSGGKTVLLPPQKLLRSV